MAEILLEFMPLQAAKIKIDIHKHYMHASDPHLIPPEDRQANLVQVKTEYDTEIHLPDGRVLPIILIRGQDMISITEHEHYPEDI